MVHVGAVAYEQPNDVTKAPVCSDGERREYRGGEVHVAALVNQLLHSLHVVQRHSIEQEVAPEAHAVALVAQPHGLAVAVHVQSVTLIQWGMQNVTKIQRGKAIDALDKGTTVAAAVRTEHVATVPGMQVLQ